MRCPSYSSDDEEPDYYQLCGREIHMLGRYTHIKEIRQLNEEEQKDYDNIIDFIDKNNYKSYVEDYLNRRYLNTSLKNPI